MLNKKGDEKKHLCIVLTLWVKLQSCLCGRGSQGCVLLESMIDSNVHKENAGQTGQEQQQETSEVCSSIHRETTYG